MRQIRPVDRAADISPAYRDTPVGRLLEYHNCGRAPDHYEHAELLVAMCMDHRKELRVPNEFAYVVRAPGGSLRGSEFAVSYAVAAAGVGAIALLAHTHCGMVGLSERRERVVQGLVRNAGWERAAAEAHFDRFAVQFAIGDHPGDEITFVLAEATRLRSLYPKVLVAPILYRVEDDRLYLIDEEPADAQRAGP